jgi:thiol-disulfide isomerase/thioredoxin
MRNLITVVCVLTALCNSVRAQSVNVNVTANPLINQLCPAFSFDTLLNYKSDKLSLEDLKGKFVIVDFWGTFCVPCIKAFPKLENLQKQFPDSLQILLVATDGYVKAKHFYDTRKKANNAMYLPCAINRNMTKYFQIREVSTYVWIDDKGFIRAITDESQLTEQKISDFINGRMGAVREKEKRVQIDVKKPLTDIVKEIDSNSVIISSVLTRYVKGLGALTSWPKKGTAAKHKFIAVNMGLKNLYQIAYGDSVDAVPSARVVIESAQPEKFIRPKDADIEEWIVNNGYCYEINVPQVSRDSILKLMRGDLQRMFGYNAFLETQVKKCLVLKAERDFRLLQDTTITPKISYNTGGIIVTNQPFKQLFTMLQYYIRDYVLIDETGLTGKIDLTINAMMNDVDALSKELKKHGLNLQFENRPLQMLVIKDPR